MNLRVVSVKSDFELFTLHSQDGRRPMVNDGVLKIMEEIHANFLHESRQKTDTTHFSEPICNLPVDFFGTFQFTREERGNWCSVYFDEHPVQNSRTEKQCAQIDVCWSSVKGHSRNLSP